VIYSDDTSLDYYSNKEGIKRFDFANIGSYTKDFSNNDLTNYIPNIETTIAESPKAGTGPALKVTQYGTGNGDSVALFNAGTEGDSMEIDYKGDINMYKNVDIYGDISANDASFNNVEIKTDLNDNDPLIKYVSGNSYIWSDNNVEEVARNDASFNVVVWRRVSQGGQNNTIISNQVQLFIRGQNILPSAYEVYNSGDFNNRATTFYRWNTKIKNRHSTNIYELETGLFDSRIYQAWAHTSTSETDNSLIIFLKSSYNIKDIQSIVIYGQILSNGIVHSNSTGSKGTILELYNDTNDVNLNNPLISTNMIVDTHLYHAYRWDFPAINNYNNFSSSPSITQIYNGNVYKFATNRKEVLLNKYNIKAPVPTQTFNVVVWRRVSNSEPSTGGYDNHLISGEFQLFIGNVNILPSGYELYNSNGFNNRSTAFYRWNTKVLHNITNYETYLFDSSFSGAGHSLNTQSDNSLIIFLKSSYNIKDIQSIVVYGQLETNGTVHPRSVRAKGTILELYNDTNDVNLNNPLISTNMIDDTHLYHAYRWDFPAINEYTFGFASSPSNAQIYNNNVYKFTTNYSNYLFDIKYLYSPITPTYINNIQSIITDNNLVIYSDDTSFDYYSNKEGIKRFDFANIGNYTKDFSNNDLTNYIPNIETTIAVSPKAVKGPALKVTQYGTGNGDSVALFNAGTEGDSMEIDYKGDINMYKDVDITGTLDVSGVTNAFVPRGIIVMWSGSNDNIPSGWVLCNGINGTPDLMNRFIIGSGSTYTTTDTGGDSSVTLTTSNLPAHSHSGSTSNNGSHSHSGTTANNGSHSHGIVIRKSGAGGASDAYRNPIWASQDLASSDAYTKTGGSHSHTFNTTNGGSHTHTFNTNNTGSGTAFNILPPYYALAYIMKT
jgi:microcystin-dependent protein